MLVSTFYQWGTLLDLANLMKQKPDKVKESVSAYVCIEMLKLLEALGEANVIHADIKPDNLLIMLNDPRDFQLHLIDFGCSIDMTLFPENALFRRQVTTENFICCEMKDNKPWNYHTDYFCVAATAHVVLFKEYMVPQKSGSVWKISQRYARSMKSTVWTEFFDTMLNIGEELPDINYLIGLFVKNFPNLDMREAILALKAHRKL